MSIGIRFKILLVALPIFSVLLIMYVVQNKNLEENINKIEWIKDVAAPLSTEIYHLAGAFSSEEATVIDFVTGQVGSEESSKKIEDDEKIIAQSLITLDKNSREFKTPVLGQIRTTLKQEDEVRKAIFEAHQVGNTQAEREGLKQFRRLVVQMNDSIEEIHSQVTDEQSLYFSLLLDQQVRAHRIFEWMFLVGFVVSLLVASMISRFITAPLSHLIDVFKKVQNGDLTVRATIESRDELRTLVVGFNTMLESLVQTQVQLAQSAKMSSLGEMASGIAHEINNPLTVITAVAERTRRMVQQEPVNKEKILQDLDRLDRTSSRIAKIIVGLRGFSRNDDNDPPEHFVLKKIVDDCYELIQEKFRQHNIGLKLNCDESLVIKGHSSQIFQVLLNLIGNARDAVEKLEDRWVSLDVAMTTNEPQMVQIRVMDSGPGIPEEILQKLMTPFFTTKPSGKGTGLGLSISRKIAAKHGGRLFYDSESKNTCFVLELPLSH